MPEFIEQASDLLLFMMSVGAFVITLVVVLVGYQVAKAAEELRNLLKTIRGEVDVFSSGRKELFMQGRFINTWLRVFTDSLRNK